MITFKDVKRENHETYLFVAKALTCDLEFCLNKESITDYKILPASQCPSHITLQPAKINQNVDFYDTTPDILISHLNPDDMLPKLQQICKEDDDDLRAHNLILLNECLESLKKNEPEIYATIKHPNGKDPIE